MRRQNFELAWQSGNKWHTDGRSSANCAGKISASNFRRVVATYVSPHYELNTRRHCKCTEQIKTSFPMSIDVPTQPERKPIESWPRNVLGCSIIASFIPIKPRKNIFIAHELQHDFIDHTNDEQINSWRHCHPGSTLFYHPTAILMFFILVTLALPIPVLIDMF